MKSKNVNLTFILLGVASLLLLAIAAATLDAQETAPDTKPKPTPSPALWAVNSFGTSATSNLAIFQGSRLEKKTGKISSARINANANGALLDGMTFDSANDLWMSFCASGNTTGYIAELSAAALRRVVTTDNGKFTTVIEDPSAALTKPPPVEFLACPRGLLFDGSGNLWVETAGGTATSALPALLEYTSEELVRGKNLLQSPAAAALIDTPLIQASLNPTLAFDKNGNLWQSGGVISGADSSSEQETVTEYTAAQLAAATTVTDPNQTLIVADTSVPDVLNAPSSLTFDTNGNLWVAFALGGGTANTGGVEMFAVADLDGTGTVTPAASVTLGSAPFPFGKLTPQSMANPAGLAFDPSGDLWIADQSQLNSKLGRGGLVEIPASELTSNGSPIPSRAILASQNESNLGAPIYITFGVALP